MKQSKIDLAKLLRNYRDGWVAISHDFKQVMLHGKTLQDVMQKAKAAKEKVYFFPAGGNYSGFVGYTNRNDHSIQSAS